jgi:adenylosuccinate synthase
MGVGETVEYALSNADAPRAGDVRSPSRLRARLGAVAAHYGESLDEDVVDAFVTFGRLVSIVDSRYVDRLLREGPCVFEGAQGVLLDEWRGWHPYTTWSTTTFDNVAALCPSFRRLGVVRTYTTRHGPGPLVTEVPLGLPEPHNGTGEWQGDFRVGHFDAVAHRYAIEVAGGVDALAVTHLDAVTPEMQMCTSYDGIDRIVPGPFRDLAYQSELTARLERTRPAALHTPADWSAEIGDVLNAPVQLESHGPATDHKKVHPGLR